MDGCTASEQLECFSFFPSPRSRFFISRARVPSSLRWATGCIQPVSDATFGLNTLKQTIPHDVVWTRRVSELNQVDVHRARTKITMCFLPVAFVNLPTFTNRNRQATHRVLVGPMGCGRPQVSLMSCYMPLLTWTFRETLQASFALATMQSHKALAMQRVLQGSPL